MTTAVSLDVQQAILDLQTKVRDLTDQLDAMRGNVTGRQMLERGALVVKLGSAARTDTAGVRHGTVNAYINGATVIVQIFDAAAVAWRSATFV